MTTLTARVSAGASTSELDVEEIYRAHGELLWASLFRLGVRSADLPDALQEVLVVVHRRLHTYDGRSRLTTWLYGICYRVAAAQRRRAHVRREELRSNVPEVGQVAPSPEELALANEGRRTLEAVLDGMDLDKRDVFVMFELEELSCAEIGELLGVPVGTVHSRLHAARKDFERSLSRVRAIERHTAARARGGTS
ncbi:MAG: sigma-70 family RNA polymerase sigma factor [Myxococcales bacterium]|nr:sigma-70 family RNA polymerase sigma factor [Myxococcales bacterium]